MFEFQTDYFIIVFRSLYAVDSTPEHERI